MDTSSGTVFRIGQAPGVTDNIKVTGTVYRSSVPNTNVSGTVTNFYDDTYGPFGQTIAKSSAYTMGVLDGTVLATAGVSGFAVTLPNAGYAKAFPRTVKKVDSAAGKVTVTPASGTIDGAASKDITTQYNSITVVSDGTNWSIV